MKSDRRTIAELGQKVRANRTTPEMTVLLQWLNALEADAIQALVDCSAGQHDYFQARVHLLKVIQAEIIEPSFAERQAKYKVN